MCSTIRWPRSNWRDPNEWCDGPTQSIWLPGRLMPLMETCGSRVLDGDVPRDVKRARATRPGRLDGSMGFGLLKESDGQVGAGRPPSFNIIAPSCVFIVTATNIYVRYNGLEFIGCACWLRIGIGCKSLAAARRRKGLGRCHRRRWGTLALPRCGRGAQ
jgi:hypothetical protein